MGGNQHNRDGDNPSGHSHDKGRSTGSATAGINNWRRSDLPLGARLRLATRNTFTKLRNRSSCCGHPGEPGC